MRPIAASAFLVLLMIAGMLGAAYVLAQRDCQRTEPQQVVGPRGERGFPGVDGKDGKPGQDCDCAALKAEAMEYVRQAEARLGKLESENVHDQKMMDQLTAELASQLNHIEALEKSACKCKCR